MAEYKDVTRIKQMIEYLIDNSWTLSNRTETAGYVRALKSVLDMIRLTPDADVAKVVKCKDCVYGDVNREGYTMKNICWMAERFRNSENFYCANGETKAQFLERIQKEKVGADNE